VAWTEIEVVVDARGRPLLSLHGRAAERARALGLAELALSLAHTREHAIACVVAIGAAAD
jgi:holo-[acyl-carrier protein] synthase